MLNIVNSVYVSIYTGLSHTQETMLILKFYKISGRFREAQGILNFFKLRVTQNSFNIL